MNDNREYKVVADYPAYDVIRFEPKKTYTSRLHPTSYKLYAGDELVLAGSGRYAHTRKYKINSVVSSTLSDGRDPVAAVERAKNNGHELHFIFGLGSVLTSHKVEKKRFIEVKHGDVVEFEGLIFTIEPANNDNLSLVEVKDGK